MLQKTDGIVLKYVKYSETSIVCKIFTREFGIRSYIINSVRTARAKNQISYFQPLSLLDLVVYEREGKSLQRIKENKPRHIFTSVPFEIVKSSLAVFITEILDKTLKDETGDKDLFDFLAHSIVFLDNSEDRLTNFPIWFLLELTRHFGFHPDINNYQAGFTFDIKEGSFDAELFDQNHQISIKLSTLLYEILSSSFSEVLNMQIQKDQRRILLGTILRFYAYHLENFGNIQSLEVLQIVLE